MITVGIDLAAEASRTALAVIDWSADRARVTDLRVGVDDDLIRREARRADKVGIDCPFGSPIGFVDVITAHHQGTLEPPPDSGRDWRVTSISAPRLLDEGVDVPDCDLGIVVAASRSRRQMIQRLGRVIRLKNDGRAAPFVILYAIDTVEDPGVESVPEYLADILRHSAAMERFALPDDELRLRRFLVQTASDGPRRE